MDYDFKRVLRAVVEGFAGTIPGVGVVLGILKNLNDSERIDRLESAVLGSQVLDILGGTGGAVDDVRSRLASRLYVAYSDRLSALSAPEKFALKTADKIINRQKSDPSFISSIRSKGIGALLFDFDSEKDRDSSLSMRQRMSDAETAYLLGDNQVAIRLVESVIAEDGKNCSANLLLGSILTAQGKFDASAGAFQTVIQNQSCDETMRATALGLLGSVLRRLGKLDKAEELHNQAIQMFRELERVDGVADQLGNLGLILRRRNQLDLAEQLHHRALDINKQIKRWTGVAEELSFLGIISNARHDWRSSLKHHLDALAIDHQLGRVRGLAVHLGNIGIAYRTGKEFAQARDYALKALAVNEARGNLQGMEQGYGNLGNLAADTKNYAEAISWHERALELSTKLRIPEDIAADRFNLGCSYKWVDRSIAREHFEAARAIYLSIGHKRGVERAGEALSDL